MTEHRSLFTLPNSTWFPFEEIDRRYNQEKALAKTGYGNRAGNMVC